MNLVNSRHGLSSARRGNRNCRSLSRSSPNPMAVRTPAEIEAAAKALKQDETLAISTAEAQALAKSHQAERVAHGKRQSELQYVMRKIQSGKVRIAGRVVEVK